MPNTLFLRLEGALQSWGERARWSIRDTMPEPTKSGVIGLLACAMGVIDDAIVKAISQQLRMGVRCDRPGSVIVDYHTVVGGVMSAEGKIKKNATTHEPETVVSERSYLCDASFLVALQGPNDLITRLSDAVQNPVWAIFLGRKACVPSRPVYECEGDFESLESALKSLPYQPRLGRQPQTQAAVRFVIECSLEQGVMRRDQVDLYSHRTYLPRYTRDVLWTLPITLPQTSEAV